MSFLGSIGTLMKGSGILEDLQTEYGKNAVEHMSGKTVTRAIWGHFLTSSALFIKLMSPLFQASFDQNNTQPDNDIYVNNTRDVSKENDNSDIDYSKDENDENTINTDDQLSESEITNFGELYKIIEKRNNTTSFQVRSVRKSSTKNWETPRCISANFTHCYVLDSIPSIYWYSETIYLGSTDWKLGGRSISLD